MTRPSLLAALLIAFPAAAAAQAPAPAPADTRPAAGEARRAPVDAGLEVAAQAFYRALADGSVDPLMLLCRAPFLFDGKVANSPEEIRKRWQTALQGRNLQEFGFEGLELLTPEEMTQRHGNPPPRLAAWQIKGGMISIGNLGGRAAIVLWRKTGPMWQAVAYHD